MKNIFLLLGCFAVLLFACRENEELEASGNELVPELELSELDKALMEKMDGFNTRVEYRYEKKLLPDDWYFITPVQEELVLPMTDLLLELWVKPLLAGAEPDFVALTFPKMLIYVGSPAYQEDGSRVLGQAEGGTIIRFTEVNDFNKGDANWMNTQLHTAFHEYCHILHQRYGLPDAYRDVTPDNYTLNGWMTVSDSEALLRGMVTGYGTSNVSEDFVELFSLYVVSPNEDLVHYFVDVEGETDENEGREFLRTKLGILRRFLDNINVDLDAIRTEYQTNLQAIIAE